MTGYAVFAGDYHYPSGGWRDLTGTFATLDEARRSLMGVRRDWWQIVDLGTGQMVDTEAGVV